MLLFWWPLFHAYCSYPSPSPLSPELEQLLPKKSPCVLPWPLQLKLLSRTEGLSKAQLYYITFRLKTLVLLSLALGIKSTRQWSLRSVHDFTPAHFFRLFIFSLSCELCTSPRLHLFQFFKRCAFPRNLGFSQDAFSAFSMLSATLSLPHLSKCFQFPVTENLTNDGHNDEICIISY